MILIQRVGQQTPADRKKHVWYARPDGTQKCVLCGGVARKPTLEGVCDRYEPLTEEEWRLGE